MLRPQLCLTVWLVLGCLYYHVTGVEENPTPECGENEYLSDDGSECHPCQELTCEAGFQPNLSCGGGNPLTGAACIKCQDGHFSNAGENCQGCSVCVNTVNDTPCTRESDIICGPCKEGYVMLGFHCRSCRQVPYPSHYEECREIGLGSEVTESPAPCTATDRVQTPPEEDLPDPPLDSLLIFIVMAGLILLVGAVIIFVIVFFCNYKRNGLCGGPCSPQQNVGIEAEGGESQPDTAQNQGQNLEPDVGDPLIPRIIPDVQPAQRLTANGASDEHPNGDLVRETHVGIPAIVETAVEIDGKENLQSDPLPDTAAERLTDNGASLEHSNGDLVRETHVGAGNDSCNGHAPVSVETDVDSDDKGNLQSDPLSHTAAERNHMVTGGCGLVHGELLNKLENSSDEPGDRESCSRPNLHLSQSFQPSQSRPYPQEHTTSQLCEVCSSRKQQPGGVNICKADTVIVNCNGQCSSHPLSPGNEQGNKKINPNFGY